mmetsp:Transcript_9320/g.24650  ORF Transcript_9320/g.24650 Transcript_9320/m.24650 type:complete len:251 (-) Transcript_9320:219-971(-)
MIARKRDAATRFQCDLHIVASSSIHVLVTPEKDLAKLFARDPHFISDLDLVHPFESAITKFDHGIGREAVAIVAAFELVAVSVVGNAFFVVSNKRDAIRRSCAVARGKSIEINSVRLARQHSTTRTAILRSVNAFASISFNADNRTRLVADRVAAVHAHLNRVRLSGHCSDSNEQKKEWLHLACAFLCCFLLLSLVQNFGDGRIIARLYTLCHASNRSIACHYFSHCNSMLILHSCFRVRLTTRSQASFA